jgi:shikimate kinase/3-dehydroquinate synthase
VTRHVFLIGFPAAGKTTVGTLVAAALGRDFVDLDDVIAARASGTSAAELVAADEVDFRRRENEALVAIAADPAPRVIATGGGAATWGDNLDRMRAAGLVVTLAVALDAALTRAAHSGPRPLLGQPRAALEAMYRRRASAYRRAHAVVSTDDRAPAAVAAEVVALVERAEARPGAAAWVALGERTYPIVVDDRPLAEALGPFVRPGKAALVADANLAPWIAAYRDALTAGGADVHVEVVPAGEASKSLDTFGRLAGALIGAGLDRWGTVWALGGGVVGDLAGFVAATLYRGVDVIQLPTTLVAMTDSAIGGKTAVDVPAGKNLVGAFHQPRLVHAHTPTLDTLPPRERRAGFGELWKYALLGGPAVWDRVAACAAWSAAGEHVAPPPELDEAIAMAIGLKAAIVSRDELERSGQRALLNLGHTIGHAIEAAGLDGDPRGTLLHGEAVGLGLVAACRVSRAVHGGDGALEREIIAALAASGLPIDLDRWLTSDVLARVALDKKRAGNLLRYVTISEVGACAVTDIEVDRLQEFLRPHALA